MVERVTKADRYPTDAQIREKLGIFSDVRPIATAPMDSPMPGKPAFVRDPDLGLSADAGRRLLKASVAAHDLSGGLDKYPEIDYGASMDFSSSSITLEDSDLK
jgi:hypothetical protein